MKQQRKVDIVKILDGLPFHKCVGRYRVLRKPYQQRKGKDYIEIGDRVTYKRTNGEVIRGFIDKASRDCLYIFNTRNGNIVAAQRDRVRKVN